MPSLSTTGTLAFSQRYRLLLWLFIALVIQVFLSAKLISQFVHAMSVFQQVVNFPGASIKYFCWELKCTLS